MVPRIETWTLDFLQSNPIRRKYKILQRLQESHLRQATLHGTSPPTQANRGGFLLLKTHLSCGRINWLFPQSYSSSTKQAFCCRVTKSMGLELRIKRNWPEEHSLSEAPHSVLFWRHPFVPVRAKRRRELQLLPEYFQILKKYIFFPVIIWMFQINLGVILVQIVLIIIPILLYMNSQTLLKIQSKRKCCQ